MRSARLDLALNSGTFVLPDTGMIAVYRPRIGDDLSALPKSRLAVVTGFLPDHAYFEAQGYSVGQNADGPYAAAIVCLPRAKAQALAMIFQAMQAVVPGGPILIDGQRTDGVDTILKLCRNLGPLAGEVFSKAHGKAFVVMAGPAPADWAAAPQHIDGGFQTLPGVFSADGPDRGSALLATALPAELPGRVVDLGAGWGYLSRAILQRRGVKELDLVEAEAAALDCARLNITDPRARFHWADAATFKPACPAQCVVMNPPFHAGRDADPALGVSFLHAAWRMLGPPGVLWLVANRHLPYDRALAPLFRDITEVGGDSAFRLIRASHPIKPR